MIIRSLLFFCLAQGGAVLCDLGTARTRTAEAEKARSPSERARLAREAIALCDAHAPAHNTFATALEEQKDYDGAAAEYERALVLEPSWYLPALGLGDVARAQGRVAVAREHYRHALDLARTAAEHEEAKVALAQLPAEATPNRSTPGATPEQGFAFKPAEMIARGLQVGMTARSPGGKWVEEPGAKAQDFYMAPAGYAANLSVLFEVSSASILPEGIHQLEELGRALQGAQTGERYLIEGHASSEGAPEFNRALSSARARSVRGYLVQRFGLPGALLEVVGRGTDDPMMENGVENPVKSRRVTVVRRYDP